MAVLAAGFLAVRILYVITDLELGGVPLHLLRLASALKNRGVEVSVASLAPTGPVSRMMTEAGIVNVGLGARGPWDWRVLERLAAHVAEIGPDIVHALLFHANLAARAACVLSGFRTDRLICEIQTAEIERPWHLTLDRWTQRACRLIVGNSPSVVDHLRVVGGIESQRLRLVRGGIDLGLVRDAAPVPRVDLGISNEDPILIWVGRLDPVKGLDELITGFSQLCIRQPCNLILVGDGAYRASVEARVRQSGFADRIRMLGSRTDVPAILKCGDVFVFPSRTEGMPNALLEGMAAGLPCIATDVPGCRDLIEHGVDGLLVPPGDPAALAGAVERVLGDERLKRQLPYAATAKVAREFDLAATHSCYLQLYESIIVDRV